MLQSCPVRLVHRHAIPKCLLAACYQLPACSLLPALACLLPTCLLAACCLPTRLPALPASPSLLSYLPALPLYRPTPHLEISTYCYTRLRGPYYIYWTQGDSTDRRLIGPPGPAGPANRYGPHEPSVFALFFAAHSAATPAARIWGQNVVVVVVVVVVVAIM